MHFNETDERDSLGLMLFPASQTLGHDPEPMRTRKKGKKMAGKAMYKISTINTIFIIDMLQKKVP